ncbi:MAG: DUF1559 domain-containing protein [Paludisphaera borealis]|uniref:DUF1559 family PulG-like putative transporter n=1 Tax=Paludisphaera borealis TaxID=1387353 RepID=UPI00283F585A|nr:DUF1559 domain-containing protein [Paludisphaera borealis]MDR3618145.1 DUF1559 domain-containing protein [Paludisphaera borealis]
MHLPRWINRRSILYILPIVVCAVFVAYLSRGIARAREAARSSNCICNFKQLGLALMNYESTHGCLPPAYVVDSHGKPLYSWRVLVLPFMEMQPLYDQIHLDEPWDGPNNRELLSNRPSTFFCPSDPQALTKGYTSILAVVGPGTLFPGGGNSARLADVHDDPGSTVMLVESNNSAIHWMEPRDLRLEDLSFRVGDRERSSISSPHTEGAHIATANDVMATLSADRSPADVKAMLLIDDGVKVELRPGAQQD